MAKRFIDTGLFRDSWFSKLSLESKIVFIWLITNCDHSGIVDLNLEILEFETKIKGLSKSFETVRKELGNRLITLRDNYFFLPKFVSYQYPNGLSEGVKAQLSVIKRLKEFELFDNSLGTVKKELGNSYLTVQDKDKDIDIDQDKDIDQKNKNNDNSNFEEIYNLYGSAKGRTSRKESLKSWNRLLKEKMLPSLDVLKAKIIEYNNSLNPEDNDQFKQGFQVWLNQERWNDEFPAFKELKNKKEEIKTPNLSYVERMI